MESHHKLSLVVPCYNCGDYIYRNLHEVIRTLKKFDINHEIIVVDDGSTDNTFKEAKEAENGNLKVVGYTNNKGKGFALKYGFKHATGDFITFADADLDIHPRQLMTLMKYMDGSNADIVIGSKRHPLSKIDYPFRRRLYSFLYHTFVNVLFNTKVKDTQSGLKLMKYDCAKAVLPKIIVKRYAFDLELIVVANKLRFKVVEAPIVIKQLFNDSHVGVEAVKNMFIDTLGIAYRLYIMRWYDKGHRISRVVEK
tara:strand:+ start:189 stop:947 length:759 start_codon:yes stop_codon:yes gene_type:complete